MGAVLLWTPETRFSYAELHMGGEFRITLYAGSQEQAESAVRAAFDRVAQLEQVFSDYRPASEARRLPASAAFGPVRVSADMLRGLRQGRRIGEASGGAFDLTASPVVGLWREARRSGRIPRWVDLRAARFLTGLDCWGIDAHGLVTTDSPNVRLDFGGLAKGDACDQALAVLRRHGIRSALVQAGGDIAASEPPPGLRGWTVAAEAVPGGRLELRNQAVSTSGDAEQFAVIGGRRWSHIVDPRTGFALTNGIQATVLARRGLDSDPLATALCVLGPEDGARLARRLGVHAWFITRPGQG